MIYPDNTIQIGEIGPYVIVTRANDKSVVGLKRHTGEWVVGFEAGFRSFNAYDDGYLTAFKPTRDGRGWCLTDYFGNVIAIGFNYIEPAGEGYYIVERGARKNILRRDGTLVLKEWPHRVSKVRNGYFCTENTIRKTATTPTRYIAGVAHVSGITVFPMIFDSTRFVDNEGENLIVAKKDNQRYLISEGSLIDPTKKHYPPMPQEQVVNKFMESIINWMLPGLQLFYRDTDLPIDVDRMYPVGKVLRAGRFTDMSVKLLRPVHKTRYVIASAHAAVLAEHGGENAKAKEWGQAVLHKNSWLKVMDVYRKDGITQILLLHIPESASKLWGDTPTVFNILNHADDNLDIVMAARESLDRKMKDAVHPRSMDPEFVERMKWPVGYDPELMPYPLEEPFKMVYEKISREKRDEIRYGSMIHAMANDCDVVRTPGSFPWRGTNGMVCEDCIYRRGIVGNGEGCGRLFKESFRKFYASGECQYWKPSLADESRVEFRGRMDREKKKEHDAKTSDAYARPLIKDFIKERLGGDLDNLYYFDFRTLREDTKYGPLKGPGGVVHYAILKAIMQILHGDNFPGLNVEALDKYLYRITPLINFQRLLGARIKYRYFKGLSEIGNPADLVTKGEDLYQLEGTIGNFWPLPSKAALNADTWKMRGYIDRLLVAMYDVASDAPKQDLDVKGAIYQNRKLMKHYQGVEGIKQFFKDMMLDAYLDQDGIPRIIFEGVSISARDFKPVRLRPAIEEYHSFHVKAIPSRTSAIIQRLHEKGF